MTLPRTRTFGELLRQYRRAAQLSQEALAERAGLSRRGVSDLERGLKQVPRVDTIDRLVAALNLTPVERAALAAAARARRSSADARGTGASAIRVGSVPALVGRARELTLLERHLAGEGPPVLLFAGEPGIGKSRLLAEVGARAAAKGWRVVEGGCQRRSGQEPYEPFASVLAREIAATPSARRRVELARCAWLLRLMPELAAADIAPAPLAHLQPEQERRMLFAAVRRYLANIAGPSGTLLVLDDLQWAAADALHLLYALVGTPDDPATARLRMVGAYRETELRPQDDLAHLLAELARDALVDRRVIGPLREQEAVALLTSLLGDAAHQEPAQADVRERIVNRTGGVPYYVVSYARELLASGRETDGDDAARTAGEAVPWSVTHSIRVRVGALSDMSRAVLEAAAIVGRVTPTWLLISAVEGEEYEIVHAVEMARGASLLAEHDHAYQFTHDLIRDVLLADLGGARSRGIHRRVAQALINLPDALRERHLAEITYHLLEGEEGRAALPFALEAGAHAMHVFAYEEAERYYRLAATLAHAYSDQPGECEALEQLARVLRLRGHNDEALEVLRAAGAGYELLGRLDGVCRVSAQMGWVHLDRGTAEQGIAMIAPVVDLLQSRGLSPSELSTVYLALAQLYLQTGRFLELKRAAERAMALMDGAHGAVARQEAVGLLDLARMFSGRYDELNSFTSRVPAVEEAGDPDAICRSLLIHAHGCEISGASERAAQHIKHALEIAERSGNPDLVAACLGQRGHHGLECGQWGKARDDFERAEALAQDSSSAWWLEQIRVHHGYLHLLQGETAEGVRLLERAIAQAERTRNFFAGNWARYRLAEWDLVNGRPETARARLEPCVEEEARRGPGLHAAMYAWALLELGEVESAESLLDQAMAGLSADLHSRTNALRIRAMTFMRQQRWEEAHDAIESALALARSLRYPFGEARALYAAGLLDRARGEPDRAREHFEQALAICDQLGEALYRLHIYQALDELAESELVAGG